MIVPFRVPVETPMTSYVLRFLGNTLGLTFVNEDGGIYYGADDKQAVLSKLTITPSENDVIWRELLDSGPLKPSMSVVPFDLIGAIGRLLWDEVDHETVPIAYDRHSRLKQPYSFQSRNEVADRPLVDHYVAFFAQLLQAKLNIETAPRWPKGKQFAIGLSHDVDNPIKTAILKAPLFYPGANNRDLKYLSIKKLKGLARFLRYPAKEEFWVFDEVMNEEAKYGFKSSSYFAPTHYYEGHGAYRDVPYDLGSPKFKRVFKSMVDAGFEIGLHAGYYAHRSPSLLTREKQRVEELAQVEVKGLRHHYWHLGANPTQTLEYHAQAGFIYDSSLAFNDGLGFRRNTALPYFPWLPAENREIKALQLPVFCMDGNLFANRMDVDTALERVDHFIQEIRRVGGMGMIDWHTRTSHDSVREFKKWGMGYMKILEHLSTMPDAWVTSGVEIAEWTLNRFRT